MRNKRKKEKNTRHNYINFVISQSSFPPASAVIDTWWRSGETEKNKKKPPERWLDKKIW